MALRASTPWLPRAATHLLRRALKVNHQPVAFVQSKAELGVLEDVCSNDGNLVKLKKKISKSWASLPERVRGIVVEQLIKSAVVTVWGAGVLTVSATLDRLGVIDTGFSNTVKQKAHITAVVKEENDKALAQMKNQYDEDKSHIKKLSEEFDVHRGLTKLWLTHLIEKSFDTLSRKEIHKIQEAFASFNKGDGMISMDEARFVIEKLGEDITESELQKMVAERGKISLPELLTFIAEKVKGWPSAAQAPGKALPGSPSETINEPKSVAQAPGKALPGSP